MWQGLVSGQWTIVDWVDTDSRRFLVAHQNHYSSRQLRALSPREVDIAEHLSQGRSTSEMAYALGLRPGTVSRAARTVLRKLGVKGRADLAALFGGVAPLKASLPTGDGLFALTPGPHPELWSRLSGAERDVIERALRGQRLAQVATARKVSVKTVKNQLGAVYARFGVRGRAELATLLGGVPLHPVTDSPG
jgi:DNA-binding CsgD family transcriptional regulator